MKLPIIPKTQAFTITEMMIAIGMASIILGVTLTSSVALQKSFNEVNNYAGTHMQQIRIIDYLARDVRRGLSVTSSVDKQTVKIAIPKYIIQANDPEGIADASKIGTPRAPKREYLNGSNSPYVNYGNTNSVVTYTVQGTSITRTQNDGNGDVLTTIASSTDNLVPETTDIELANTEYTTTAVTFKPISIASRTSTAVYSTAYLRNRRRPPPPSS